MMPDLPSIHALVVMGLTAVGLYMFSRDWIPIETTGLVILATIVSLFFIFPYNFNGNPINPITFFIGSFGNEALITICLLLAVGKAIEINHSLQPLVGFLSTSWLTYPKLSLLGVLLFGAFFSAFINNTPISYTFEGEMISLDAAPMKEHVHVYDRSVSTSTYMVPFHVDNGIYLIITPFEGHALKLKLSNNKVVSTEGLEKDSVIVLFGRGLTEWLLQNDVQKRDIFHAVPHAVPTTSGKTTMPRTVYARMKIAQPSAIPNASQGKNNLPAMKKFEEVFMEAGDSNYPFNIIIDSNLGTTYNDLCPISTSRKEREVWIRTMENQCDEGEGFCWMACLPLPEECPDVDAAMCYNDDHDPCFDDSMDPSCAWHCK